LQGLSAALARTLGELGVGGSDMATLLSEAVEAECLLCRITVSGADLISMGLHGDTDPSGVHEKLIRLRLGYCCRKGCLSSFYVVRFAARPGIEWGEVWDRAQPFLGLPADHAREEGEPPPAFWKNTIPVVWVQRTRKPILFGVVILLVLGLFNIGGCRTGLLHKSRVFIVSSVEPSTVDASVHGEPSFVLPHALGP